MPARRNGQQEAAVIKALNHFPALPDDGLVGLAAVQALFGGISRATLYRRITDGTLPKVEKIGGSAFMRAGDIRRALNPDLPRKAA